MTREICSHHFWGLVWLIVGSIILFGIISDTFEFAKYGFQFGDISNSRQSVNDYVHQQFVAGAFYILIIVFIIINLMGLFFANERYAWFAIKECPRN